MEERENKDEAGKEARRILKRVERESNADHGMVGRAKRHLSAADADQADAIELWGTRIGRALSLVLIAAAIVWLLTYLGKAS
ncbi:hypothetical protein [Brucella sp. IR073]|uniref:hypothetical protein n=1 Tax=unclassified Brucella TaxID=2632610 RepID=UPI003B984787